MRNIYTSIDIGTDTIKIIVCELYHNKLNLLASSSSKSKGIKKGLITDISEASQTLMNAIDEVQTKIGVQIHEVIVNIPSYLASYEISKSSIDVTSDNSIITGEDIVNVLKKGVSNIDPKETVVSIIPIDFIADDGIVTKDPKGKKSTKLQSRSIITKAPTKTVYSIVNLLEKNGLEIVDIVLSGIGDIYALKNKDTNEKLGAIINIGSEVTTISLYNKGIIFKNSIINLGGKAIDNDISYIYKTSMIEAKKIKEKFALATKKHSSVNDLYDIISEDNKNVKINQAEVSEVVMARLEEILSLAKKEINILTTKNIEYIIITGGTSNIKDLDILLDNLFGNIASIAKIKLIGIRNNKYSTSLGNILYYLSKQKLQGQNTSMINEDEQGDLSSVRKNLINISNESMIGKVVDYFFGE